MLFAMALEMARQLDHVVTLAFCFPGLVCIAAQDHQPHWPHSYWAWPRPCAIKSPP